MVYLDKFVFLNQEKEESCLSRFLNNNTYITSYPFGIFPNRKFENISFSDITIFYGDNGSGKSTALNVIANKINAERFSSFNTTSFFEPYVNACDYHMDNQPQETLVITSDAVFDYLFNVRAVNQGVDINREKIVEEYLSLKKEKASTFTSVGDYEKLEKLLDARRSKGRTAYFRKYSINNVEEESNGESALRFFQTRIKENGIYLLDEPENSLSPARQLKLKQYIEESVRFYNCQFIIATHSPFIFSLKSAKIYNLDLDPIRTDKWTNLDNVKTYYNFFRDHMYEFTDNEEYLPEYAASREYKYGKIDKMIQARLKQLHIDDEYFYEYIAKSLKEGHEKSCLNKMLKESKRITKHEIIDFIDYVIANR